MSDLDIQNETEPQDNVWGDIPEECRHLTPKWVLNGFPKSGLHLVTNMMRPLAAPMPPGQFHSNNWVGTFNGHSWKNAWGNIDLMMYRIARTHPGYYVKGHIGYREDIDQMMHMSGMACIFIFRDMRDVAVSQAHHILSEKEELKHPNKDLYRDMSSFEDVLEAVIAGVEDFPGVMDRWEQYAGWISIPWVLRLKYEEIREDPEECAGRILRYGGDRVAAILGFEIDATGPAYDEAKAEMAEASRDTSKSPTYRKGAVGGWQEVFTKRHRDLFKESDKQDWLIQLGYASDHDW